MAASLLSRVDLAALADPAQRPPSLLFLILALPHLWYLCVLAARFSLARRRPLWRPSARSDAVCRAVAARQVGARPPVVHEAHGGAVPG
jgi:hypothetical protein